MASYSEFLKLLHEIPREKSNINKSNINNNDNNKTPPLTSNETYDQLCYDFPQLSIDDLSSFKIDFIKSIEEERYDVFPINNRFVHGLAYGASKYGGKNNNKNNNNHSNNIDNTNNKENNNGFYEQYSTLNGVVLVKFIRNVLRYLFFFFLFSLFSLFSSFSSFFSISFYFLFYFRFSFSLFLFYKI